MTSRGGPAAARDLHQGLHGSHTEVIGDLQGAVLAQDVFVR